MIFTPSTAASRVSAPCATISIALVTGRRELADPTATGRDGGARWMAGAGKAGSFTGRAAAAATPAVDARKSRRLSASDTAGTSEEVLGPVGGSLDLGGVGGPVNLLPRPRGAKLPPDGPQLRPLRPP